MLARAVLCAWVSTSRCDVAPQVSTKFGQGSRALVYEVCIRWGIETELTSRGSALYVEVLDPLY